MRATLKTGCGSQNEKVLSKISGRALVFGNNVNTDALHPSQFYSLDDKRVRDGFLQAVAGFEQLGRSDLSDRIILAGDNFGCGSSRETGARALIIAGIRAVIARSIARIFARNIRNLGLLAVECPLLRQFPEQNAEVELNLHAWALTIPSLNETLPLAALDPFWAAVFAAGGLLQFVGVAQRAIRP